MPGSGYADIGEYAVNLRKITSLYVFAAILLVFIGFGCSSTENYIGQYRAIDNTGETQKENLIDLKENGEGIWACCDGEVSITWYVKGKELRINTREGGIMVGKLKKDSFVITLPGKKVLTFIKVFSQE